MEEEIYWLKNTLESLGYCHVCNSIPQHHLNEPFASCDCGTREDHGKLPLQKMQLLETKIQHVKKIIER